MPNTLDSQQGGNVGAAVYAASVALPKDCPPEIELDLASGLRCLVERSDSSVQLTLSGPRVPDQWPGDEGLLAQVDDEAHRVVASLCFNYAAPFKPPVRESPRNPDLVGPWHFDVRPLTYEDMWPEERARLVDFLREDDPRSWPLWQTLTSVGTFSDPLAKFVALWGLLDIGLDAEREQDIDDYLFSRFGVARDHPGRYGNPNRETKFTHLRHSMSHPAGRSVDDVAHLASDARSLVVELAGYCRTAVQESFRMP